MNAQRGRQRDRVGTRPLARFIEDFMAKNKLTAFDDFRTIAAEKKMKVSGETFRKAATDGYRQPLNDRSVAILAAGLRVKEEKIRELDAAYWYPAGAPVGANVDPELLNRLATASPDDVQRVKDFLAGIQARP